MVAVVEDADAGPLEVSITGEFTADSDFLEISNKDLKEGELFFGLPAALIVLLLVFGAVVASLVPLLLAIVAITLALALVAVLGQVWVFSFFVVNMLTGMGLALGVDYALFIVSRFREERRQGVEKLAAIEATGRTASRAVFFSGSAFVIALTGMLLVPDTILRSLAAGAILVGITAVVAATTLLPAVLALLGDRVDALRVPFLGGGGTGEGRFWGWVVDRVQRRPVVSLVLATAFLLALALPALDLRTGSAGIRTLPDTYASKRGFNALEEHFGVGTIDSAIVVVDAATGDPEVRSAVERLAAAITDDPAFREPETDMPSGRDIAIVEALVAGDSRDESAVQAIERLRSEVVPEALAGIDAEAFVTGETAEIVDYRELMERWLPVVFLFVLALSFILLTVAFRSIVVPAKAIVLNLLSVGAAYGVLVLVFQKGVGNEFFGFPRVDSIEAWLPLFLFSVLFALSMDYHVFLLSRIRERYGQTRDNSEAVGVRRADDRAPDHGRRADHHRRLLRLRDGRPGHVPADGLRDRDLAPDRRDGDPVGARARRDGAPRRPQLVSPGLARVAPASRAREPARGQALLGLGDEAGDAGADLGALVLLQEVPGAADDLRLARTGDVRRDPLRDERREDRVRVREEHERGLLPAPECLPHAQHRLRRGVLRLGRVRAPGTRSRPPSTPAPATARCRPPRPRPPAAGRTRCRRAGPARARARAGG